MRNLSKAALRGAIVASILGVGGACARSEPPVKAQPASGSAPAAQAPVAASEPTSQERANGEQVSGSGIAAAEAGSTAAIADEATPSRTPDVVYVPTPQGVVDKMLDLAKPKKTDIVYDLGCGDGRIVVTAAKKYGTKAFGFDIDPERVAEARENVKKNKVEHLVTIEQKDIFTLDLSPADVVTLYLLPRLNVKLIPQLQKLKPGSRIVSHDFDMQGVTPIKHLSVRPADETREHEIYFWKAPIRLDSQATTSTAAQ